MKTMTLIICAVLLVTSYSLAGAVVYTGAMENRTGSPFIAGFTGQSRAWTTGGNANAGGNGTDGLRLEWQADNETTPGSWTYTYRVLRGTARNHGFAYFDIETASDFTAADVLSFQPVSANDRFGAPLPLFELATITLSNPVNFTAVHDYSNAAVTETNVTTALNKTELSHYSGDPGIAPVGLPGGLASDTPTAGPIAHPFFGLRVNFPGDTSVTTFNAKDWEVRLVSKRAPMWGSFFGWGSQTATSPFWYANFYDNNIDNPARLSLAPATSLTGAPPYQGWVLVPGPLPTVISTTPAGAATGVPVTDPVTAIFGGDIDPATITPVTFNLGGGRNGTVVYDAASKTATFTPTLLLPGNATITATIVSGVAGVKDLAGNALAADKVWSFTTALVDTLPPTVVATIPGDGSTFVPVTGALTATFNEEIDPATLAANFTITGVTGTTGYNSATRTATFTPSAPLANNTVYTMTLTTGVKDVAGNAMAVAKAWSFTTIPAETILPVVATTIPNDVTFDVPVTRPITATFSEPMDPATINAANFSIAGVTGTVSFDAATNTAALTPDATLALATNYTATITTGVKDLAGNALPKPKVWSFTTSPTPPAALPDGILVAGETQASVQDAVKVLRLALNLDQATQNDLNHGDVAPLGPDGKPQPDGKVNIQDAVVILRKAVGLISW